MPHPTTIPSSSPLRRIAGATGILIAAQILNAALQLISLRTVQNNLTKAENGEFFWVQQISLFVMFTFVEMGMNAIATRMVIQSPLRKDGIISTFFRLRLAMWCAASAVLCSYTAVFAPNLFVETSLYMLCSLLASRSLMLRSVLEIDQRSQNLPLVPALTGVLDALLLACFIVFDPMPLTPLRVVVWFLLSAIPGFCIMLLQDKQWKYLFRQPFDTAIAHELLREAMPIFATTILLQIQDKSDTFMLDYFHGKEAVGIYGAAMRIVIQGSALLMIIPTVISPTVSALKLSNEERCKVYMVEGLNITLLIASLIAAGMTTLVEPTIFLSAGTRYLSSIAEFSLAAWSLVGSMIVAYILALFIAIGEQRKLYGMFWTLCIASLLCNVVFTPHWGVFGAMSSKIVATFLGSIVGLVVMQHFVGKHLLWRGLMRICVVIAVLIPSGVFLREAVRMVSISVSLNIIFQHLLAGASICAIFGVMCVLTGFISAKERALIKSLLQRS
jgi:O-antigen/teichoic acid export membrane protein